MARSSDLRRSAPDRGDLGGGPSEPATTQNAVILRNRCVARQERSKAGFTLVELMLVVVVLSIVSVATFSGIGNDSFDSRYRTFADDVQGIVVQARNMAIDQSTLSMLRISDREIGHQWVNPLDRTMENGIWLRINEETDAMTTKACVAGLFDGVQAPGMPAVVSELPKDCLNEPEILEFHPDGSFVFPNSKAGGAGVTLVLVDLREKSNPIYTLIEIYPGGMIRKIDNISG